MSENDPIFITEDRNLRCFSTSFSEIFTQHICTAYVLYERRVDVNVLKVSFAEVIPPCRVPFYYHLPYFPKVFVVYEMRKTLTTTSEPVQHEDREDDRVLHVAHVDQRAVAKVLVRV